MKKKQIVASLAFLFLLALFFSTRQARAQEVAAEFTPSGKRLGFGAQVGSPTALTLEAVIAPELSVDAGLGGLVGWGPSLSVHGDVLWSPIALYDDEHFTLSPQLGVGTFAALAPQRFAPLFPGIDYADARTWTGLRAPLGMIVALHAVPIGVYAQAVPTAFVYPHLAFDVGLSLGLRFYV